MKRKVVNWIPRLGVTRVEITFMRRVHLIALLLIALAAGAFAGSGHAAAGQPRDNIVAVLQPFLDNHTLAGAVTLVASSSKVLSLEAVDYMGVAARRPMRTDALFWIASQSKAMTASALMMLVDEGKVNPDDPMEKYLPEFKGQWLQVEQDNMHLLLKKPRHPITIKNVLSYSSGLPFNSLLEEPTPDLLPLAARVESYAMLPMQSEAGCRMRGQRSRTFSGGQDLGAAIQRVVSGKNGETPRHHRDGLLYCEGGSQNRLRLLPLRFDGGYQRSVGSRRRTASALQQDIRAGFRTSRGGPGGSRITLDNRIQTPIGTKA